MIQERPQYYVFRFPNPNATLGLQELGAVLTTDSDAPFRCYGVAVVVYGGTSGQSSIALRFTRADRTWVQKILVPATAIDPFDVGNAAGALSGPAPNFVYFAPLSPNILYPPTSAVTIDIQDLPSNKHTQCLVIFIGTKLFAPGMVWAPDLPKNFRALPFLSYPLQIQGTSLPVLNLPFNVDTDAGFLWQYGSQTAVGSGGSFATFLVQDEGGVFFTLTAVAPGAGGNLISFEILPSVIPTPALLVTVVGNAITVTLKASFGPVVSSIGDVAAALTASVPASALVTVSGIMNSGIAASTILKQFLAGGGGGFATVPSFLGLKIKDWTGKPYMNDFVPAELIFGFDNLQVPGFPYPEIFIPRKQALLIDAIAYGSAGAVTTLAFKGQKIYG
jgi:hypothetical protein